MIPVNEKNAETVAKTVKDTPILSPGSVRRSTSIQNLAAAMVAVQKQIEDPVKNKKADAGTRGSYRYADLPTVLDAVRPALVANGFAVMQFPCELDDAPALTTILIHTSGEWVETTTKVRPTDPRPQNIGSAISYARRYALLALCGIAADDDDDGRAASRPAPPQQQQKPAPPKDNPQLRAKHAQAYKACGAHNEYQTARRAVVADIEAGNLSQADIDALRALDAEVLKRFPAPQPAAK